ncbi:endo-1,4-beta-xylanase [Actinacidiphila cocklensis]|jgi:endo-1,4-beta-xylanase|uniref:Beta-xylanase n=1 Tax=Actinacidiphila cocklensis TaxID=887465 RepID=A0A9W4DN60_9ACTN|nr:endo-1,4-beta-xylanase [Actinacidiphila cocklensis]CAG6393034.1 Beta-xylanase [Actinacidiphila cocklensis]
MLSKRALGVVAGGSAVALLALAAVLVAHRSSGGGPSGTAAQGARPTAATVPLRDLAAARGIHLGTALAATRLTGTPGSIAARQFDAVTPENEMKWESVEPERGTYDWAAGDAIVAFAKAHGMQVRGHNLVWHSQLPEWLTTGDFSDDELRAVMLKHVTDEVTHYKGRIAAWDVVNEPFTDDGGYRAGLWYRRLGVSYIADAFRAAHAADPAAKLYLNDYGIEGIGPKSDAMYALATSLKQQGVPIDGVGFQAHFALGRVPADFRANLQRFAGLGLDVAVTELDVRMPTPPDAASLRQQADDYDAVLRACLAVARCRGVTVWGFSDATSWVPGAFHGQGAATPYDAHYRPKPAYDAIAAALLAGRG